MTTIIIAHVTFCMAYVTSWCSRASPDLDESLEEAAMDLGARPVRVFFDVTLPVITPALVAGWLLAFTLSLDDLVVASFVTGPGASTLPMVIFSKVRLGVSPRHQRARHHHHRRRRPRRPDRLVADPRGRRAWLTPATAPSAPRPRASTGPR